MDQYFRSIYIIINKQLDLLNEEMFEIYRKIY